jgi:hypothetical protein
VTAASSNTSTAGLSMTRRAWWRLIRELARRGHGNRESGAFLLARAGEGHRRVVEVAYYDDLDPDSLRGNITFSRDGFARLNDLCRERLAVAADVHTHPTDWISQSETDRTNPMVRIAGHVAVIVPNYARGRIRPSDTGVHLYEGNHRWTSRHGRGVSEVLTLTWWSKP